MLPTYIPPPPLVLYIYIYAALSPLSLYIYFAGDYDFLQGDLLSLYALSFYCPCSQPLKLFLLRVNTKTKEKALQFCKMVMTQQTILFKLYIVHTYINYNIQFQIKQYYPVMRRVTILTWKMCSRLVLVTEIYMYIQICLSNNSFVS